MWFKSYPYDSATGEVGEKLDYDGLGRVVMQSQAFRPATGVCETPQACEVTHSYVSNCTGTIVNRTVEESRAQASPKTWRCHTSYGNPEEQQLTQV